MYNSDNDDDVIIVEDANDFTDHAIVIGDQGSRSSELVSSSGFNCIHTYLSYPEYSDQMHLALIPVPFHAPENTLMTI